MNTSVSKILFVITLVCLAASACTPTGQSSPVANTTAIPSDSMVLIPAGSFSMGTSVDQAMAECSKYRNDCQREWFTHQAPAHTVDVPAFYMDIYEVTNGNYLACETAGVCQPPRFAKSATHEDYYGNSEFDNYSVINVNWGNAQTYCEWRGARLPTEAEWEKAARGTDGRTFPWGEGLDTTYANYADSKFGDPVAVGSYEKGKSPYGLYDMAGNVWEWVEDWYGPYPGGDPAASPEYGQKARVLRGGAWFDPGNSIMSSDRGGLDPTHSFGNIGFRCAKDAQ